MAVTSKVYGLALQSFVTGQIAYTSDTIKAMLCTSSYVPDQDTHRYKSSVTNEITGTGYTAGGVTLTSKTVTYDTGSNALILDCDDPSWTSATIEARYLVFYKDTGTASTSPLISYVDFGTDEATTIGTFTYVVPSDGIAKFTAA